MNAAARRVLVTLTLLAGLALFALPSGAQAGPNVAEYMEVTGYLDEPSVTFIERQVNAAAGHGAAAVIIRIDSPGGLDTSAGPAIDAFADSKIPVIVWVAAGEAQAGGWAAALALASHHLVMGPEATIGPAVPLDLKHPGRGAAAHAAARQAVAVAAGVARRSLDPSSPARLDGDSLTAEQAKELGIADGIEPNVQELLAGLKGATVRSADGTVTFSDEPFTLRFVKMTLLERLIHSAARPAIAYLLLLIGIFGLVFELYNPGIGAAAVGGGVALIFAFYSFTILPTNWVAMALILAAFIGFSADMRSQALGGFSIGGTITQVGGSMLLYSGGHQALRMPLWAVILGAVLTLMFFLQVMTSAIRARTAKPIPGADGLMGAVGVARTDIAPDGQVMARGTLWRARTLGAAIGQGSPVKIRGVSGLMLMVEPTNEEPPAEPAEPAEPEELKE